MAHGEHDVQIPLDLLREAREDFGIVHTLDVGTPAFLAKLEMKIWVVQRTAWFSVERVFPPQLSSAILILALVNHFHSPSVVDERRILVTCLFQPTLSSLSPKLKIVVSIFFSIIHI